MATSGKSDNPFAALAALREQLPTGPTPAVAAAPTPATPASGFARAVVRLERKGRGGKEVTVVEKLGAGEPALADMCKRLKQALGCGGAVDRETIVLQGDLRERLPAVLTKLGVRNVVRGT